MTYNKHDNIKKMGFLLHHTQGNFLTNSNVLEISRGSVPNSFSVNILPQQAAEC